MLLYRQFGFKNFHPFVKWEKIDFCEIMKMKENILTNLVMKLYLNPCKEQHSQFCHECPLLPGKITINRTHPDTSCPKVNNTKLPVLSYNGMWERDGEYQYLVRFFNAKDDNLFSFRYFYNVKVGDTRS